MSNPAENPPKDELESVEAGRGCVLLTGTIRPSTRVALKRSSASQRLLDYKTSLAWWSLASSRHDFSLVFIENSGYPLTNLTGGHLRARSFPDEPANSRGKGWGEDRLMARAFSDKSLNLDRFEWVAKCTGRLMIRNLTQVLPRAVSPPYLMARFYPNLAAVDTRWFAASPGVWRQFLIQSSECVDDSAGVYLENVMARRMHRAIAEGANYVSPKRVPRFSGLSATSNLRYDSPKFRLAAALEDSLNAIRRAANQL